MTVACSVEAELSLARSKLEARNRPEIIDTMATAMMIGNHDVLFFVCIGVIWFLLP